MSVSVQTAGRHRALGRRTPNRTLQALRINLGLSPNDLAYRAGISGNSVRSAEAGFLPSPRTQFKIARELGCSPLDIWPLEVQLRR